ncbi:MAG: zinc-binding dehydrogenase, partial [Acidimicrobiaceae bacterium]|nr:zinc-binding dehydrogenase [Acidimicrobiaceae bacterium]
LEEKVALTQRFISEMLPMFEVGKLRPIIDSRYPLENISAAHRYMETNASTGKIVIDVY